MEAAVPMTPEAATPAKKAAPTPTSFPKPRSAAASMRRKTLCDITNLRGSSAPVEDEPDGPARAESGAARLLKENADLVRRLGERDEIIELSGTEIQKLRLANWELARANSQMLAELNFGKNRLKALQHELACSRVALKAKTLELEDARRLMKRRHNAHPQEKTANPTTHHLGSDRAAAQIKDDGGVVDPEPTASEASHAGSIQRPGTGSASRKRMLRSRSLGPAPSTKLALSKEKETTQRRKSMRMPQASDRKEEDLFELEDVQLAIGGCKIDPECAFAGDRPGPATAQYLRRSSLGLPLRQARGRVSTYKEVPLNIKLRSHRVAA